MAASTTPRLLQFSIPSAAVSDLMLACLDYQNRCRREHRACPESLVRLPAQLSGAVRSGQEQSTFALPEADAKAAPVSAMVTYRDAAGLLAWSESTLRRRVREGLLEPVRAGRTVRLRRIDIDRLIEGDH